MSVRMDSNLCAFCVYSFYLLFLHAHVIDTIPRLCKLPYIYIQVIKNIKNVTRCRDSRRSHKKVKYTNLLHIFFRYTHIMEKDPCRGLYT